MHDMIINLLLISIGNFTIFCNITTGYRSKCLLRPWEDPIDGCVANEPREAATIVSKRIARWRHAEDYMQIFSTLVNVVLPNAISVGLLFNKIVGILKLISYLEIPYPAFFASSRQLPIITSFSSSLNNAGT